LQGSEYPDLATFPNNVVLLLGRYFNRTTTFLLLLLVHNPYYSMLSHYSSMDKTKQFLPGQTKFYFYFGLPPRSIQVHSLDQHSIGEQNISAKLQPSLPKDHSKARSSKNLLQE